MKDVFRRTLDATSFLVFAVFGVGLPGMIAGLSIGMGMAYGLLGVNLYIAIMITIAIYGGVTFLVVHK